MNNIEKLARFVDERLAAAEKMPAHEAVWFCDRWAAHVERQLQTLSNACRDDASTPEHLVGLDAMTLAAEAGRLRSAAVRYRSQRVAA
jgi:hypothetical protein